jgi:hypothetical protein
VALLDGDYPGACVVVQVLGHASGAGRSPRNARGELIQATSDWTRDPALGFATLLLAKEGAPAPLGNVMGFKSDRRFDDLGGPAGEEEPTRPILTQWR